ncbi:hypothetical protein [Streptomyces sp. NPDC005141]
MDAKDKGNDTARDQTQAMARDENTETAREQQRKSEADELRRRMAALAQQPPRSLKEAVHRAARKRTAEDADEDPGAGVADGPPARDDP